MAISFKSVGKTQQNVDNETQEKSPIPFGIKTPLRIGAKDGIFEMNYSLTDQFADNLRNLLLTNWGERLALYRYGANLRSLVFLPQDEFDNQAIERIREAVEKWMPFIDLENFSSETISDTGSVKINVTYNIPALNVQEQGIQVVISAI
jgi:phage baseplate assembly protein W